MNERDLIVSLVACLLGLVMVWSGATNNSFAFKLWLPRLLESKLGRQRARWILMLIGAGVISLGGFVAWKGTSSERDNSAVNGLRVAD